MTHDWFFEKSSSRIDLSTDPLMREFKLVGLEVLQFENQGLLYL